MKLNLFWGEKMAKKLIMVVDDEEDNIITVKSVLEANGFDVVSAINGDDCLEKLKKMKKKPNLILMDIMMPGTPVRQVVKKITKIPVSYLSVVRLSEAEKEDLIGQKNIVDFIQKPFDIDELIKKVKKLTK